MTTDMKRLYVVERLPLDRTLASDEAKAAHHRNGWLSVGQYDDPSEAGRHAADLKPTIGVLNAGLRVRQFWVSSPAPEQKPLKAGQTAPVDVPLVQYTCFDHPDYKVAVHNTSNPGRCKHCGQALVTQSMADALATGNFTTLEVKP